MENNALLINNTRVATDEVATRLRSSFGSITVQQAALCFAFYNDTDLVHFSSLDTAEKALFAPQTFGQFLLPRQGTPNTQWAPCLVRTPEGDPLTLTWYATFAKNGNFTQVGEYFDTRNSRDMGKMAIPMTLDELGKLSARFQMGFISSIKTLPRDIRAASVQTQNLLSLASKKVNSYYTSLNSNAQVRTAPNFLKIITASNSVAVQLITNCIFPKPSSAPAPAAAAVSVDDEEEDEDLRSLTVSDLLSQQTDTSTNSADANSVDSDNSLCIKDLPDPHGHFRNLMRQYDIANMKVVPPCVRDAAGLIIQPSEYASKLVDGAFLRVSANLQTYQFTNRSGTLVRVLQLRLVTMDVLPSTLEGIIAKYPAAVAKHLGAFDSLKAESKEDPPFATVLAHVRSLEASATPETEKEKAPGEALPGVNAEDTDSVNVGGDPPVQPRSDHDEGTWQNLPFRDESLSSLSSLSAASTASTPPPSTPSDTLPTINKRAGKRRGEGSTAANKSAAKRAKTAGMSTDTAYDDMEGVETTAA